MDQDPERSWLPSSTAARFLEPVIRKDELKAKVSSEIIAASQAVHHNKATHCHAAPHAARQKDSIAEMHLHSANSIFDPSCDEISHQTNNDISEIAMASNSQRN